MLFSHKVKSFKKINYNIMLNFLNLYPKNNFYNFKEEYFFLNLNYNLMQNFLNLCPKNHFYNFFN